MPLGVLILWIQSRLASEVPWFRILMAMVFVAGLHVPSPS
jgi:hypothetical protein